MMAHPMSLQFRIIGSIAALLLLTLLAGAGLLCLHARSAVLAEVRTAFQGAERSVRDTLKSDVQHTVTLREVVANFQGQRHVRAALVNEKGKVIVQSDLAPVSEPAPAWFARTMMPPTFAVRIPISLPQYPCMVVLTSDPRSEIADAWRHARDTFLITLLFCVATMAVIFVAIHAASRFFRKIEAGLLAISGGRYETRLAPGGPPEFSALARGFNHMAAQLDAFSRTNRQLYAQLQGVQDEERASIARDLHDEVGPYLFALQVDAKAVTHLGTDKAHELGASIRDVVIHIQEQVQALIRQLRPASQLEFGLKSAIDDMVTFWKRRHPGIAFDIDARPPDDLPGNYQEAVFRILQESLSNAVRHGNPSRIAISLKADAGALLVAVEDDGKGVLPPEGTASLGRTGVAGMRERVAALHGQFAIEHGAGGTRITATLPLEMASARTREPA
jgi:two-component system sensor histidine kinase UhpB